MRTTEIKIGIGEIDIDEEYFSFEYKIFVNGELRTEGEYQDSHDWGDSKKSIKEFKKILEDRLAVELALENF